MKLKTIPYNQYENIVPQKGNYILGQEIDDSIYVYQAYNPQIANYAVTNQKFGGNAYSFNRMTWIKPNFLWMMYRAGWATKVNQERILAIRIPKQGFYELLETGVYSSYKEELYESQENWKAELANSDVRIQWDPDHNPIGDKLERRAVQIGIRGKMLEKFNNQFIQEILDITEFVAEQRAYLYNGRDFLVIAETVIDTSKNLKEKYLIGD